VRVLNKAFTTFGMPESIYTDNGRDYTSKHYTGVLQELGITHLKAKVGQVRQKGSIIISNGDLKVDIAIAKGLI